jgi:hypothetical protein
MHYGKGSIFFTRVSMINRIEINKTNTTTNTNTNITNTTNSTNNVTVSNSTMNSSIV